MKIAHIQVLPKLSGAQQISLDILSSLSNCDHDLYIISGKISNYSFDYIKEFENLGVNIIEIPSLERELGIHDIRAFKELYRIFKIYDFDIIHTNSTKPAILARIAARFAGCKKIVHTVHGIAFHKHIPLIKRFIYFFAEYFSVFFGHTNITVNKFYTKYYPFTKTKVIYNGVDFSKFKPNKNNEKSTLNFAFFARLDEQKNPIEYIEAIYLLKKQGYLINKDIKFYLAGDGELLDCCTRLVEKYDLNDKISIIGWVVDKDSFLNSIDVIVQPSKWEAFGLVFVESAFFGIPSIATNVEGIPEVIEDGVTGLLYTSGAENLKNCMLELINDPNKICVLGANAKDRAIKKFSKENMIAMYHIIYFGHDNF